MSEDVNNFKKFLNDVRNRAMSIMNEDRIHTDARKALADFIEVARQTERLLEARTEQSADSNLLKKRYEQLKIDHRELEKKAGKIAEIVSTELAPVLKTITGDTLLISERAKAIVDEKQRAEVVEATNRVKLAVRKIVEVFTKL